MPYNPRTFAVALLDQLGIHPNPRNVQAVVGWARAEGGHWNNSARYNPLNTTLNLPGASAMNGVGVKAYQSWDQGLHATVKTLRNGHYGGIIQALRNGGPRDVAAAIDRSPWGTHGSLIYQAIAGTPRRPVPGGGTPTAPRGPGHGSPGRGGVASLSELVSSPGAVINPPAVSGLGELLSPQQPAVPITAPQPMAQGADRYLRGASAGAIPSLAPPVVKTGGLSDQLSSLGATPSLVVPGSSKQVTVSGVKPELSTDGFGKRGGGGSAGRQKAVAWAQSVVGKAEINGTNRSPWIDHLEAQYGFKGAAWCAMFTSKAIEMGGLPRSSATASVAQVRAWAHAKSNGYKGFVSSGAAKPGDLILWGNEHIGMVVRNTGRALTIIAGNDSNRVNKRTVPYGNGDIVRPNYRR